MYDNLYYNTSSQGCISDLSVTSAGNLKEQERQERNRFTSLLNVSPRSGSNKGRLDLNDWLTSNEELFSLLVHNTNVVSGPVIGSSLIKKKKKRKRLVN